MNLLKTLQRVSKDIAQIRILCYMWNDPSGWSLLYHVLWLLPQSLCVSQWIFSQFREIYSTHLPPEPLYLFFPLKFLPTSLMDLISHHLDLHRVINCSGKISLTTSLYQSHSPVTFYHYILFQTYYLKLSYLCIWLLLFFLIRCYPSELYFILFIYLFSSFFF